MPAGDTTHLEEPQLRADARRNLQRILTAARDTFAEMGVDVGVAEVARRAGVGNATVFRRFPTKDDLVHAVVVEWVSEQLDDARRALADVDPVRGMQKLLERSVQRQVESRGGLDSMIVRLFGDQRLRELHEALGDAVGRLLERAQAAGAIRCDLTVQDVALAVTAVSGVGVMTERGAPGAWRRYLRLVLDGFRACDAEPLSPRSPSWKQIDRACASICHDWRSSRHRIEGPHP